MPTQQQTHAGSMVCINFVAHVGDIMRPLRERARARDMTVEEACAALVAVETAYWGAQEALRALGFTSEGVES